MTLHVLLTVFAAATLLQPAALGKEKKRKTPDEIGNSRPDRGVNLYSQEKEIAIGREMAKEVEGEVRLGDDGVVSEYVNRLGQNLVRNSDALVPFTIKVIDSEDVNAFALPGGFMFVNTGLILQADSEAELAGVLAHEIAHVAARHGTKQATRGQIIDYASIPLIFMGGWAGFAVRQVMMIAVPIGFLRFSRAMESEADHLGLEYLYKSGYDPTAFVDFFEKMQSLEKRRPGTVSRVFSTHPMTNTRIRDAQKEIQEELALQPQYVVDTSEFHEVKERLMATVNRRQKDSENRRAPALRHRPGGTVDMNSEGKGGDEERPRLKRAN